jgi:membrane protease subunit HflC
MSRNVSFPQNAGPLLLQGVIILAILIFIGSRSLFVVNEWEQALVIQFGEVRGEPITEAGLHFKLPWQTVETFDRRLLRWDGRETTTITRDRKTIIVDTTARWRISDANQFRRAVGTLTRAETQLDGIIDSAIRNVIGRHSLFELVRSTNDILNIGMEDLGLDIEEELVDADATQLATLGGELPELPVGPDGNLISGRPLVINIILRDAQRRLEGIGLGIELDDILIKQLNYNQEIEANVFAQMNAELAQISAGFRSHGRRRAEERLGQMERDLAEIQSAAMERVQVIRGNAEAESIRIYAEAFTQGPEFFGFLRTLEALEKSLGKNLSLFISSDSPIFQPLQSSWLIEEAN